jgi:putative ABC transport system permease protein
MARFDKCVTDLTLGFHERLVDQVKGIPGVQKVSPVAVPPFLGANVFMLRLRAEGQTPADAENNPWVGHEWVGPEYFDLLGLPILKGRGFTEADREGSPNVAVVSEDIAKQLWPGQDPIGKRIHLGETTFVTVIGVVREIHFREHRDPTPMIIRPYLQGFAQGALLVRTRGPAAGLGPALRDAVHNADPGSDFLSVQSMDQLIAPQLAQPRLNALLLSAFALAAVLLAAIGLYGIMASAVSQQTRELGVRMALGATPPRLRQMVLGEALTIAGAGAIAGLAAALAASRVLRTMLFEVSPTDPETLIGVSLLLLAISLLAAYLPARRATQIDPARALRAE